MIVLFLHSGRQLATQVGKSELVFGQLGSWTEPAQPTEAHKPDQVGQLDHFGRLLLDQDDGHAQGPELGQGPDHLETGQRG